MSATPKICHLPQFFQKFPKFHFSAPSAPKNVSLNCQSHPSLVSTTPNSIPDIARLSNIYLISNAKSSQYVPHPLGRSIIEELEFNFSQKFNHRRVRIQFFPKNSHFSAPSAPNQWSRNSKKLFPFPPLSRTIYLSFLTFIFQTNQVTKE